VRLQARSKTYGGGEVLPLVRSHLKDGASCGTAHREMVEAERQGTDPGATAQAPFPRPPRGAVIGRAAPRTSCAC